MGNSRFFNTGRVTNPGDDVQRAVAEIEGMQESVTTLLKFSETEANKTAYASLKELSTNIKDVVREVKHNIKLQEEHSVEAEPSKSFSI